MFNYLSIDSIPCKKEAHPLDDRPQDVLPRYPFFPYSLLQALFNHPVAFITKRCDVMPITRGDFDL